MNQSHLTLDRLEAGATPPLTPDERRHLSRCPQCRVEMRLLHEMAGEVPQDLPGLEIAQQSMALVRSSMMLGFSTQTQLLGGPQSSRSSEEVLAAVPELHYETIGPIGVGGMGEVWRVRDPRLRRQVAMKWLKPSRLKQTEVVEHFVQEARLTAQLQHPGIVPVHEFGQLPDGRPYFTMKEVKGRTLLDVVQEVHRASSMGVWMAARSGWTFRRVVDAFHRACEAVAYAHSEGVLHRDLKPANIMVGAYGEVQVLDWGLARVLDGATVDPGGPLPELPGDNEDTHFGSVVGTVPYMPPEQARGDDRRVGPASDVYALGATLYHILTGRPPYMGGPDDVLMALAAGPPARVSQIASERRLPPLPDDLVAICERAMSRHPGGRHADAGALAADVADWLDGARRREQALAVVDEADALTPEIAALRDRAGKLEAQLRQQRLVIRPDAALAVKRPVWALEDSLAEVRDRAAVLEVQHLQLLRAALTHEPQLAEAHDRLADHHYREHAAAEARADTVGARRHELMLRAHGQRRYAEYLQGHGGLSLATDPPEASATLYRHITRDRRLCPEPARDLGLAPLEVTTLPMGSYVVEFTAPGRSPVKYPVQIGRLERWTGVRPGDELPSPVRLLPAGALGAEQAYVPAGWCRVGGDPHAQDGWPARRIWVDGFVMQRFPVTNREYLAFLNDLLAQGHEAAALSHAPRERAGTHGERGALIYTRAADGSFTLGPDSDADHWEPDWPVIMIDWFDANAYASWLSQRDGLPWRLPHELEWEKAARGADGRAFPWGDTFEPLYCCMRESPPGRRSPEVVRSYPEDESPYGVRGMAGNVGDWCSNRYDEAPPAEGSSLALPEPTAEATPIDGHLPARSKRGGAWQHDAQVLRVAERHGLDPSYHSFIIGFRLVRSVDG